MGLSPGLGGVWRTLGPPFVVQAFPPNTVEFTGLRGEMQRFELAKIAG